MKLERQASTMIMIVRMMGMVSKIHCGINIGMASSAMQRMVVTVTKKMMVDP